MLRRDFIEQCYMWNILYIFFYICVVWEQNGTELKNSLTLEMIGQKDRYVVCEITKRWCVKSALCVLGKVRRWFSKFMAPNVGRYW